MGVYTSAVHSLRLFQVYLSTCSVFESHKKGELSVFWSAVFFLVLFGQQLALLRLNAFFHVLPDTCFLEIFSKRRASCLFLV